MDYKKTNAPLNTVTHDLIELAEPTGNIYETVCIISKRANQIAAEMKRDLEKTASKLKFRNTMSIFLSLLSLQQKSLKKARLLIATWLRIATTSIN